MSLSEQPRLLSERAEALFRETDKDFVVLRGPAPRDRALTMLNARVAAFDCYWSPPPENSETPRFHFVGFGAALSLRLEGPQRFSSARNELERNYARIEFSEATRREVRFFGGAAFQAGRDGSGSCWQTFGDASFFLPRVLYRDGPEDADFIVLFERGRIDEARNLLESLIEVALRPTAPISGDPPRAIRFRTSSDEAQWEVLLDSIRSRIAERRVDKIVAARRVTVQLSSRPEIGHVLGRLSSLAPQCTHFSMRLGEKTFLGATPELLVEKTDDQVRTEALAGSIAAGEEDAPSRLLASRKDRSEHDFVVQEIQTALAPVCETLEVDPQPSVRELTSICHLSTALWGKLRVHAHVLDLVELLHPTPAVGGVPRSDAVEWIAGHEPAERGWYASPFGWVDAEGNGRFMVALRSALLSGDKVHVYAGAGIVSESRPSVEFAETELKLKSMLGALGIAS